MRRADASNAHAVLQLFDSKAASWPEKYSQNGRLADRLANLVQRVEACTPPGGQVLDIGCGSGDLAIAIASGGRAVTACDISSEMLSRAEQSDVSECVQWVKLPPRWADLSFPDRTFDLIYASSVLEYVEDPAAVFRECARVLRPGGRMLCTVPDVRHPIRWVESIGRAAARLSAVRALCSHERRISSYLTYLQVSRHRHRPGWWQRAAGSDLLMRTKVRDEQPLSPLRLLFFDRRDDSGMTE